MNKVSVARLNFDRFEVFNDKNNISKPIAFIFSGDTFNGLSIRSLSKSDLDTLKQILEFYQVYMVF